MNASERDDDPPPRPSGGRTSPHGTPVAVDLSDDRRARSTWLVFTAGPITWFAHFMLVYLVAEAGCTGDGPGLDLFDHPVPVITTIVATVVAVLICAASAVWGWRIWRGSMREDETTKTEGDGTVGGDRRPREEDAEARRGSLAFAGSILSQFSIVAVLYTAAPALVLWSC